MSILIKNGLLVHPDRIEAGEILIDGEFIVKIAPEISRQDLGALEWGELEIIDAGGGWVFPGFIDAHTHYGLGEGSDATADDFFTGSRAAAWGGITTFIDFSDQVPERTLLQGALLRINQASDSILDYSLHQGIYRYHPRISSELDELISAGIRTLKIFTTYDEFGVKLDSCTWDALFSICRQKKILLCVHGEDDDVIRGVEISLGADLPDPSLHSVLRPAEAEAAAFLKVGKAAFKADIPLYLVHISSRAGLEAVEKLRKQGLTVGTETAPHYLFLTNEKLGNKDGALYLMTPPLRCEEDRTGILNALVQGQIDVVATDHCSYRPERKLSESDCRNIPAGVPGSEEMSGLIYSGCVSPGKIDIIRMENLFCSSPAKIFGLYPLKGSLLPGSHGDIAIFSAGIKGSYDSRKLHSASGYTIYEGFPRTGAASVTILRGKVLVRNEVFLGEPGYGRFIPSGVSSLYDDNNTGGR